MFFLGGFSIVQGQENRKAEKLYQEALVAFKAGELDKTDKLLEKVAELGPEFSACYLLKADVLHKRGQQEEEMQAIEAAVRLDSLRGHTFYFFVLADGYFDRGDYETARKYYRLYQARDARQKAAVQVKKRLLDCEFALNALRIQKKQETEPVLLEEHDVYWPALDVTGRMLIYTEQAGENEQMWMRNDSSRYPVNFNSTGKTGAASLTADGRIMYFTMIDDSRSAYKGSDIYVAYRLSDTSWSEPVNLGEPINTEGWEAQPAVSADGTRLYFASTREGGRGGSDIWYSRLLRREADGRQYWSKPRCLYFNTPGDEMAPFLYFDNKTLFFASDDYPGMGRKDIYKVDLERVTTPLHIGVTVNTQKDEMGFVVDASGKWGYFSSGISGKKAIYRYRLEDSVACEPAVYIRLQICDVAGNTLIPDRLTLTDMQTGDTLAWFGGGHVFADMPVCVPADRLLLMGVVKRGYMYYSDTLQVQGGEKPEQSDCRILMQEIKKERSLVLKGVFFDVDDYRLKPQSYSELQQVAEFMRLNPDVEIEISGHTDNSGSGEHNYRLSEDRAFEVYKYLFTQRVRKERMTYKGYGKDKPLVSNDTEAGKAVNRRTEIQIK